MCELRFRAFLHGSSISAQGCVEAVLVPRKLPLAKFTLFSITFYCDWYPSAKLSTKTSSSKIQRVVKRIGWLSKLQDIQTGSANLRLHSISSNKLKALARSERRNAVFLAVGDPAQLDRSELRLVQSANCCLQKRYESCGG